MNNIQELQNKIEYLEKENQFLKSLLDNAGISYDIPLSVEKQSIFDPDQGARILPKDITAEDANAFFSMFWGRTDVYSKRSIRKSTGEVSYYTQCYNFWKNGCPRINGSKIKCQECDKRAYKKLEKQQIIAHLKGVAEDATDVIGIYPLLEDETCRFIVFDFDNHEKDAEKQDFANVDDTWQEEVEALREICVMNGIEPLVERSRSGRGAHLWIFFQKKIEASLARKFGNALLRKGAESVNLKSFKYYDRMLPMQEHLPQGGIGNLIALPLQGQALKVGNSAFVDENWNAYPDQWEKLMRMSKLSKEFIEEKMKEWKLADANNPLQSDNAEDNEKPWDKTKHFVKSDVEGKLCITLANGVYVDTSNLAPRIQNRIRELAAFRNPAFYKNQAMGLSNFANARFIYLGSDENGYIRIPRGLLETVIAECDKVGIEYVIQDERCAGRVIKVEFQGELKESQIPAVEALVEKETGILNAATAFGKTVVCCNVIAQKKVSTLILLQSSALLEQWESALEKFLQIDEELPEYETPSGRKKRRKSIIGKLQGAHDSTTGIIDIAMVGSVCKKGEFHKRLKEYGLVLVDECHHAASDTIVEILQEVKALAEQGYKEITLLGQNVNSYGKDLEEPMTFAQLLERICRVEGEFTVRFMTSHPKDATRELIDVMAQNPKIARAFHLPLQSGSNRVLQRMNRKYTTERYLELVDYMREKMPDIALTTDIIVAFPGESEEDFEGTLEMLRRVEYDNIYSFIYSKRKGTPAADYPDQIDPAVASDRFARMIACQQEISARKNKDYTGEVLQVLVEGYSKTDKTKLTGRTEKNRLVHFEGPEELIGQHAAVLIKRSETYALFGELAQM